MSEILTCIPSNPLFKLETGGVAPELKYNLPQTNSFVAHVYIPLAIATSKFKQVAGIALAPATSYYDVAATVPVAEITASIASNFVALSTNNAVAVSAEPYAVVPNYNLANIVVSGEGVLTGGPLAEFTISGQPISAIAAQAQHNMPIMVTGLSGSSRLEFRRPPEVVSPSITIVEHYVVATYLGDYGAAKVVKTHSLAPGEKTTITVKSYKQLISNKKAIENVLDSFSDESAEDLEQTVEKETNFSSSNSTSSMKSSQLSGGVNLMIPKINLGVNISGGTSKQTTVNSFRNQNIRALNKSISKQTQKSVANRQIQVNTEVSTTETTQEETSTVRQIENPNLSRTINYVFRQLTQELITITYLDDVSFVFSNGYEESKKVVKLDGLYEMLQEVITTTVDVDATYNNIIMQLANIFDHQGIKTSFVEKVTETLTDPDTGAILPATMSTYHRKSMALLQTVDNITVNGIIKDVSRRTLPTDSVIMDAVLGQGEALDCFNQRLQDSKSISAALENNVIEQQMEVIDALTTPLEKATNYKNVFQKCCENTETTVE